MRTDDVITRVLRKHAVRDLLMVPTLRVKTVFVLEDLSDEGGTRDKDVPSGAEEDLYRAILLEGTGEVFLVEVGLVNVFEEREKRNIERDGGDVLWEVSGRDEECVGESKETEEQCE